MAFLDQKSTCTSPQQNRKSPQTAATSSGRERKLLVIDRSARQRRQQRERHEREEPREVEVEPVREHELEADQHGGGERSHAERRATPRKPGQRHSSRDEQHLERALHEVEIWDALRVVLPPVPQREG